MSTATRFTRAIVRRPSSTVIDGLRSVDRGDPDVDALRREHAVYVDMLTRLGLTVEVLDPLDAYPDSLFVEDPALVLPGAAILLRPGAPSRLGETLELAPTLRANFATVISLGAEGFVDGGDVLITPHAVYIGLSARTDLAGATALADILIALGRRAAIVTPPSGLLHLKTGCALVDDLTVLATRAVADAGLFSGLDSIVVPEGEEAVANALCINGVVLIASGFPRTATLLESRGYDVRTLAVDEVMKMDAGLSCMSLRW